MLTLIIEARVVLSVMRSSVLRM